MALLIILYSSNMKGHNFSCLSQILNIFRETYLQIDKLNMSYLDHMLEVLKVHFINCNNLYSVGKVLKNKE